MNSQAFKTPPGDNPYLRAREEWLERYGSYIERARQWRSVAVGCLALAVLSVAGNVIQAGQHKVVPYVVEVDKIGRIAAVNRADSASATPRHVIQAELARFITRWRTVTADLDLQKSYLEQLSYVVSGSAKGVLRGWYELNNPYEIAKSGRLIHVTIKGLPHPVSADSWRVEWSESIRSHSGALMETGFYEATLGVQIQAPATDAQILQNPGGVYVTALSHSSIIQAAQPAGK